MSAFGSLQSQYMAQRPTRAVQSNMIASGFQQGDPRATTAQYDRGGFSRGAGSQYLGGVNSGNAIAEGRINAANVGWEDYNANRSRQFQERTQQGEYGDALAAQNLRNQAQYNQFALGNMGRALQRQQIYDSDRMGFLRSAGGALMGLMR